MHAHILFLSFIKLETGLEDLSAVRILNVKPTHI